MVLANGKKDQIPLSFPINVINSFFKTESNKCCEYLTDSNTNFDSPQRRVYLRCGSSGMTSSKHISRWYHAIQQWLSTVSGIMDIQTIACPRVWNTISFPSRKACPAAISARGLRARYHLQPHKVSAFGCAHVSTPQGLELPR